MTNVIETFTNTESGMTVFVSNNTKGGFNVSLRDDDSGLFVGLVICGIKTIEAAYKKAKEIVFEPEDFA